MMAERVIRTPLEEGAMCMGFLMAARMLREHAAELREKAEAPTIEHFDYLAGLLEQTAAERKPKVVPS